MDITLYDLLYIINENYEINLIVTTSNLLGYTKCIRLKFSDINEAISQGYYNDYIVTDIFPSIHSKLLNGQSHKYPKINIEVTNIFK